MKVNCSYQEFVFISKLNPHPKNRNKHSEDQIERLAKILSYQGWRRPVRVSRRSGFITAGHGAVLAARFNKWEAVPVDYQDYESEEQEYADVQADNAIASWAELDLSAINLDLPDLGPDFDIDMLGLRDFELEPADKYGDKDADETPNIRTTSIQLGDFFTLRNHRLLCGDSTDASTVARLMDGEKADMVYTDPPYGVNEKTNRKSSGRGKLAEGLDFPPVIGDASNQTAIKAFKLCNGMPGIWWGANYYAHSIPEVSSWLIWDKRGDVASDDNADCEMAWVWNRKPARVFKHLWKGCIRESEKSESKVHPTQKPVAMAEWAFKNYGEPKIILDLFLGSGSTLIACEKTNRKCFGMEIDPQYCQVIIDRWEKFTGQKAVKL